MNCFVFYAVSVIFQPLNNSYRQWTTGDQKSSFELSAQVNKNISRLPKSILLKFQKVKLTSAMMSGTLPAATASGLMRQTVTSFLPSENEWFNKKIKKHYFHLNIANCWSTMLIIKCKKFKEIC